METVVSKILTIVISFAVSFILGVAPIKILSKVELRFKPQMRKVTSLLNCFAGGVFLATVFLHLLPGE